MSGMTVDADRNEAGVSYDDAVRYWSAVPATVDGMLGGYGGPTSRVPRLDIAHSKRFLANFYPIVTPSLDAAEVRVEEAADGTKRRRLSQGSSAQTQTDAGDGIGRSDATDKHRKLRCVDCGAGIGRVSRDLLVHFADTIDIVEPCRPLCEAVLASEDTRSLQESGKLGNIHVCGIQDFDPTLPASQRSDRGYDILHDSRRHQDGGADRYDFIWNQWCLGQLDDDALIAFLKRCKTAIGSDVSANATEDNDDDDDNTHRYIFVKENVAGAGSKDIFDATDSSWTRAESSFLRIFEAAGLKVVRSSWQHGFPKELFRVKVWALK